jgi:hypothetical protein
MCNSTSYGFGSGYSTLGYTIEPIPVPLLCQSDRVFIKMCEDQVVDNLIILCRQQQHTTPGMMGADAATIEIFGVLRVGLSPTHFVNIETTPIGNVLLLYGLLHYLGLCFCSFIYIFYFYRSDSSLNSPDDEFLMYSEDDTTPYLDLLLNKFNISSILVKGGRWFVPKQRITKINDHTFTIIEDGIVVSTEDKFITTIKFPTNYYSVPVESDDHFIVYEAVEHIHSYFYRVYYANLSMRCVGEICNVLWSTIVNPCQTAYMFYCSNLDINHYNNHGFYTYKDRISLPGAQRNNYYLLYTTDKLMAWHFDFEAAKTTLIITAELERVMLQIRNCTDNIKFNSRVLAALNSQAMINKYVYSPQYCVAVSHYASQCNAYINKESIYRPYLYVPYFFYSDPDVKQDPLTPFFKTTQHECTCFFTTTYKTQKPSSYVDCPIDICSNGPSHWYSHVNNLHQHILYPKKCVCNALRAVRNRQNVQMGDYNPQEAIEFMTWVKNNIQRILPIKSYSTMTQESWLDSLPGQKRKQKEQGVINNNQSGVLLSKFTEVKAFMKIEPLNRKEKDIPDEQQPIDPRLISGRHAEYDVIGGPIIKRIAKIISSIWSYCDNNIIKAVYKRFPGVTFFSTGHNKISIGNWFSKHVEMGNAHWYNTDYKRFDASTQRYLLELEADIYASFMDDPSFKAWLSAQFETHGVIELKDMKDVFKLRYGCNGTRKSGDQNTSVGNTLINTLVQIYALSKQYPNVLDLLEHERIAFLVLGDDTVIVVHESDNVKPIDMNRHLQIITNLGLQIEMEKRSQHDVSFCSSYFVPAIVNGNETYILTQKLGRNLSRAYTTPINYTKNTLGGWLKSNAYAFAADYRHIPSMHTYHQAVYDTYKHHLARSLDLSERYKHLPSNVVIEPSSNLHVWSQYVYNMDDVTISNSIVNMLNKGEHDYCLKSIIDVDIYGTRSPLDSAKLENHIFQSGEFIHDRNAQPIPTILNSHDTTFEHPVVFDINIPKFYMSNGQRYRSDGQIIKMPIVQPPPPPPQVPQQQQPQQNIVHPIVNPLGPPVQPVINDVIVTKTIHSNKIKYNKDWDDSKVVPVDSNLTNIIGDNMPKYFKNKIFKNIFRRLKSGSRHPICRLSRYAALSQLLEKLIVTVEDVQTIYEIGSRPSRSFDIIRKLLKMDVQRSDMRGCQPNICCTKSSIEKFPTMTKHTLAEAISSQQFNDDDTLFMVDVLYYIKPYDLYRAVVRSNSLFSVHCKYYDYAGNLNNEVTWSTTDNVTTYIIEDVDKNGQPTQQIMKHPPIREYHFHVLFTDYDGQIYSINRTNLYDNGTYEIWHFTSEKLQPQSVLADQ